MFITSFPPVLLAIGKAGTLLLVLLNTEELLLTGIAWNLVRRLIFMLAI